MPDLRFVLAAVLLLAASIAPARGQTTLVSPNPQENGAFGRSVAGVPDVDGDGVGDHLVSAPNETVPGDKKGRAYLFSGATGSLLQTFVSPASGSGGFASSVAGIPDRNGDGAGDIVIAANYESVNGAQEIGRVYVFSGATGALLDTISAPLTLQIRFGQDLATVPDVNGDGFPDLVIGSIERFNGDTNLFVGRVFLFDGASGELIRTIQRSRPVAETSSGFGYFVGGLPDANGDGRGDVVIGAYSDEGSGPSNEGQAYIYSGATGALLHTLSSGAPVDGGYFGINVAGLDDVDGDGRGDVAAGGNINDPFIYVYSGATGARLYTLGGAGSTGFGSGGGRPASVPDADDDGRADLLIGAPGYNVGNDQNVGRVYLLSGATGSLLAEYASPAPQALGSFGGEVTAVPDQPGVFLIGASGAGTPRIGAAYTVTIALGPVVNVPTDESNHATSQAEGTCDVDRDAAGSQCTLRAAIELATALAEPTAIAFRLPESERTINVTSALPALPDSLTLSGGANRRPSVRIDGGGGMFDGLSTVGRKVTIEGVSVTGFRGAGIVLGAGPDHVVRNTWVGIDRDGAASANGAGVLVGGPGARITDSVISGNAWPDGTAGAGTVSTSAVGTGVIVSGATASNARLTDSLIGVARDSLSARLNTLGVVVLGAPGFVAEGNTILGATAGVRLSGVEGSPTTGAQIKGNHIGLLPTNQIPTGGPSEGQGMLIDNATNTIVGGAAAVTGGGAGNVIGGWSAGVLVFGNGTVGTRILGNLIGTDTTGTAARPNRVGVNVVGPTADTRIGGWAAGERNVISGNLSPTGNGTGVAVVDSNTGDGEPTGTVIAGNYIGTDRAGTADLGNERWGVYVGPFPDGSAPGGVSDVLVGVTEALAPGVSPVLRRNVITNSGETNVRIDRTAGEPGATTQVVGNWIGLDANGAGGLDQSELLTGTRAGVYVSGTARVNIGGWGAERNVIGGNVLGIWLDAPEGVVVGNTIGADPTGLERRANYFGLAVSGSRARIGMRASDEAVPNVISGNVLTGPSNESNDGVGVIVASRDFFEPLFSAETAARSRGRGIPGLGAVRDRTASLAPSRRGGDPPVTGVVLAHNLIGTTAEGDAPLVAQPDLRRTLGAWVATGAVDTHVYQNAMSGNARGLLIAPSVDAEAPVFPTGTRVAGNRVGIGTQTDAHVPNVVYGINVDGALDTVIGDEAVEGEGPNRIIGNAADDPDARAAVGVALPNPDDISDGWPVASVTLSRNVIWGNQGLGIVRNRNGTARPNGPGNTDGTASFDTPLILSAVETTGGLSVSGTTNGTMTVEVYADRPCDSSGYGEGRVFLGTLQAFDGAFGGIVESAPFVDWRVSATGTNVAGTTSEFSPCQAIAATGDIATLDVQVGQTAALDGPDINVTVTINAGVVDASAGRSAAGTLYAALHRTTADDGPSDGAFDGSATSDDGTSVTPNGIQQQRFWSVLAEESLNGITYEACLRYDGLFSLPVPGQLVLVSRQTRGEAWTPHNSTLRSEGGEDYLCADGLTAFGELAIGADNAVNPVPTDPEPGEEASAPTAFSLQVYPNPARTSAIAQVALPEPGTVRVSLMDLLGREVAVVHDGPMAVGMHTMQLDLDDRPTGVYVVRIVTPSSTQVRRITVIR